MKKWISLVLIPLITLISISCGSLSKSNRAKEEPDEFIFYPPPPATARIQFLKSISGSNDIVGQQSKFKKYVLGEKKTKSFFKPFGVYIRNGKIYVCDPGIHGLEIIGLEENTFDIFTPTGKGLLKSPLNCFVDKQGYLYVADGNRQQVVIFDEQSKYINAVGGTENYKPIDIFVKDNKIWVTDIKGHKVHVYNKENLQLLYSFPELEQSNEYYLHSPTNIWVTSSEVYVTDFGGFNIKVYDHSGRPIKKIGSYGKGLGQFLRPKGVAVDNESNLYVVDASFENTQIFNKEGQLLMFFGGHYKGKGDMSLPAQISIDYENIRYFQKYVDPKYDLKYLILVTNQYGPDKLNIYGFIELKK